MNGFRETGRGSTTAKKPVGTASEVMLDVQNLRVSFPSAQGPIHAVRGVSYQLRRGEVLGIVGESGSGKSMTALAIMGLLPKNAEVSGSVTYDGTELIGRPERLMSTVRGRRIAMIFQDPMTSLNPVYTVGWQIVEALRAHDSAMTRSQARQRAIDLLDTVGIPSSAARFSNYPHEFSGGMRQRVVIAIAMANNPDIIIADEPTTALDVTVQSQVLEALSRAREQTGASLVLITHDLGVIAGAADRVLVMYAGRAVEVGTVDEIYYESRMPYTLGLLGSLPRLDRPRSQRLIPISGRLSASAQDVEGCQFAPRCPMREDICGRTEPDLLPTTSPLHTAACHFANRLEGVQPGDTLPGPRPETASKMADSVRATEDDQ